MTNDTSVIGQNVKDIVWYINLVSIKIMISPRNTRAQMAL